MKVKSLLGQNQCLDSWTNKDAECKDDFLQNIIHLNDNQIVFNSGEMFAHVLSSSTALSEA